jgi:hypothetical protein
MKTYTAQSVQVVCSQMQTTFLAFPGPAVINLEISFRLSKNKYIWVSCDFSSREQDKHKNPHGRPLGHVSGLSSKP